MPRIAAAAVTSVLVGAASLSVARRASASRASGRRRRREGDLLIIDISTPGPKGSVSTTSRTYRKRS